MQIRESKAGASRSLRSIINKRADLHNGKVEAGVREWRSIWQRASLAKWENDATLYSAA
jgi:hypothetical protein